MTATSKRQKLLVVAFLRLLSLGVIFLLILHISQGVLNQFQADRSPLQYVIITLQLVFEAIIFVQTSVIIQGVSNALRLSLNPEEVPDYDHDFPSLDVFIPIRRVDFSILDKTLNALINNGYPGMLNIFIADDTPEPELSSQAKDLSQKFGVNYIYNPENKRYKSGMLNIAIKSGKSDFISFFDYDQIPQNGILKDMMTILLINEGLSFVQAKKSFQNLSNISKIWSALLYLQYFEVFERTKQASKTVLFAGSTACFRRNVIDEQGGIPEDTFTEDNGLSILLLLAGKPGHFLNKVGSIGTVPSTYPHQISQLWRWSHGASHVLKNNLSGILRSKKLSWNQKIEVIGTLGIGPTVVLVYLYSFSFIYLIQNNVDSARFVIMGISTVTFIPIVIALTYVVIAIIAIWLSHENELSEFKFQHLPGFMTLALAGNLLVASSGITGALGLLGPDSKRGTWNHKVHITSLSLFGFLLGLVVIYYSYFWFIEGFKSALLLFIIGLTLLPSLPVGLYYRNYR